MKLAHLVPAGVVLLALGVIAGAAQLAAPAAPGPVHASVASQQVAVTSAARACPPVAGGGPGRVAFIAAGPSTGPSTGPSGGAGQAELAPLPLAGAALRALSPISPAQPGALSVTATGTMAQAMEAEEATSAGLASVRCGEPGSDIWFVGAGRQSGVAQIQLDLMNVDALPASVDVDVITDAGLVQAGDDTGITVAPHQTVTESLSSMVAGSSVVAIEVRTSIGRVAADVSESSSHGGTANWLPSTVPPSTQLVIPGVPPSGGTAGLYIVVPGSANARVSVLALSAQGRYRPFGSQTVDLPGDSASYVPLTPLGGTAALELTANVPVTAAVLVPGSGLGAFTVATAPISEQAVVAGNATGSGLSATIVLSAPDGPARVRLTELAATPGATSSRVVTVPAGHTLSVPAARPRGVRHGSAFVIVIAPLTGSGPLYAARLETQGQNTVVSIIPAISALTTITLPPVRDSYDAVSP
jgi:hypothetical protein